MKQVRRRLEEDLVATLGWLRRLGADDELSQLMAELRVDSALEDAEHSQADEVRELRFATRARLVGRARSLTTALRRIDAGEYGRCGECGEAIGAARLRALPEAATCIRCQERLEAA